MERIDRALERLRVALTDPTPLARPWVESGRVDDPAALAAWVGAPAPEAIDAVDRVCREQLAHPLDPMLRRLWERFDGIAIGERWEGAPAAPPGTIARADVAAIGEPVIWPAGRYGNLFDTVDVALPDDRVFVAFGEIPDSGWIGVGIGAHAPGPVFWQDVESHLVPAHRVADDVASFLEAWVDAGLHLPTLLGRVGAPGWGA